MKSSLEASEGLRDLPYINAVATGKGNSIPRESLGIISPNPAGGTRHDTFGGRSQQAAL